MHAQYNQLALENTKKKIYLLSCPATSILANQPPETLVDDFFPSFLLYFWPC